MMETQAMGNSAAGYAGRPAASAARKPLNMVSEERPSANARAVWTSVCLSFFLMAAGVLSSVRGGGVTATILELNDMFDRVWCPLPTWAHIGLVIAAWALFFHVGADFLNTLRKK